MELETYGFEIKEEEFEEARTSKRRCLMNKPEGGLWSSPKDSTHSWKDWCMGEDFRINSLRIKSTFKLKEKAKILVIDSIQDLTRVFEKYGKVDNICGFHEEYLDFTKIKEDYDAIHLTAEGEWNTRFSDPYDLYGWDCETVLVLRWDAIDEKTIKVEE